jgi:DNA-binding winged helix-turn-helix (wHTH) protein/TolB-like protein/Tfp pilus assembly protein PilF
MSRCRFGLFEFDRATGELRREGDVVKLQPQPAKVLALLLERPGELVTRDRLKSHIWGEDTFVDFERGLNFCVVQVRTALGDASDNPRFVQTIPRKGYRFIAPVAIVGDPRVEPDVAAAAHAPVAAADDEAPPARVQRGKWRWMVAATALLVVAPVAGLVLLDRPAATPASTGEGQKLRVAVLPFVNLTGDQALDYVGDGLTDEVIAQLGLLSGDHLAVIARTSAMSYRRSSKTVAEIGRELDVQYLVESSVRRHGDGLRTASRLIRVRDQVPAAGWSETFGPASSPGDLQQTRAATRLARLVALELVRGPLPESPATSTINGTAWNRFLKGKALTNSGSVADIREALVQFETAAKDDPAFAPALAKIAEVRHLLAMMGALPPDAYDPAETAARQAVAADPNLAEAHLALGLVLLWHDWRPAEAAQSFERALALNPSLAAAHHDYAWALVALGRDAEAVRHISEARSLDPLSTRANNDVGWLYLQLRQPVEAARACEQTLAVEASSLEAQACLERAYAQRALFDAALEAAKATIPASSGFRPAESAGAEAALRSIWQWRLAQLEQLSQTRWISAYTLAALRASLGDVDHAIRDLETAYGDRSAMMVVIDRDPSLDPLRRHPRMQALIAQVAQQRTQTHTP